MRELSTQDLENTGVWGKFMIFFRGSVRPVWCYSLLFIDYMVFSGSWQIKEDSIIERTFFLINILVLGFVFGERVIRNISPFIIEMRKGKGKTL